MYPAHTSPNLAFQPGEVHGYDQIPTEVCNGYGSNFSPFDTSAIRGPDVYGQRIYNSEHPLLNIQDSQFNQKLGEDDQDRLNHYRNDVKQEQEEVLPHELGQEIDESLFDGMGVKEENREDIFGDFSDAFDLDSGNQSFLSQNSKPKVKTEALERLEKGQADAMYGNQQIQASNNLGLHNEMGSKSPVNLLINGQNLVKNSPIFPPTPNVGALFPHQSPKICDQLIGGVNYMMSPPAPYEIPSSSPFKNAQMIKTEENLLKNEGNFTLGFPAMKYQDSNFPPNTTMKSVKKETKNTGKRSKYKMIPTELKRKAVNLALQKGPKFAASFYRVPTKSLKRWMMVGCERKKGGGRKTKDPQMEKELYQWYLSKKASGAKVTARMIKNMAITISHCDDFIASKGWLDKFKVRYNLEISKETQRDTNKKSTDGDKSIAKNKRPASNASKRKNGLSMKSEAYSVRRSINKSITQDEHMESEDSRFNQEQDKIHVLPETQNWNHNNTTIKEGKTGEISCVAGKPNLRGSAFTNSRENNQFDTVLPTRNSTNNEMNDSGNNKISIQWDTNFHDNPHNLANTDD
mmetsp:Transcript_5301/g.5076  ORF Transcript_5301/g.5076 Transcript_5301/m.5076 type:complete len:575 (-) Transcript_5301:123-1847(-)